MRLRFILYQVAAALSLPLVFGIAAADAGQNSPVYIHDYPASGAENNAPQSPSLFPRADTSREAEAPQKDEAPPVYVHDYKPAGDGGATGPVLSLRLHLGNFSSNGNPELRDESGGFAYGLEFGFVPKKTLSYRLELFGLSREYDATITGTPLFGTVDTRMGLDTMAILFGVRASYPPKGSFRFHGTGGPGIFFHELSLGGTLLGIPGTWQDETDSSLGLHAGAGVEVDAGDWVLGLDFRRWFVHGSFGSFGLGSVDLGGNYFGFSFGKCY